MHENGGGGGDFRVTRIYAIVGGVSEALYYRQ